MKASTILSSYKTYQSLMENLTATILFLLFTCVLLASSESPLLHRHSDVEDQPLGCLCSALQEEINMGMFINMTLSVALPEAYSLKTPEIQCHVISSPVLTPIPVEPSREPSLLPKSSLMSSPPKYAPVPQLSPPPPAPPILVLPTPVAPVVPLTMIPIADRFGASSESVVLAITFFITIFFLTSLLYRCHMRERLIAALAMRPHYWNLSSVQIYSQKRYFRDGTIYCMSL